MNEDEKTIKARKQLAVIGASCVAVVVFTLWLVHLPKVIAYNREHHPSTFSLFGKTPGSLHDAWNNVTQSFTSLQK